MNQARLLAQARKLQQEMAKAQEELAETEVTGSAGGGAVTVTVTCDQRVKRVHIAKESFDSEDLEMLEDVVLSAVNDALTKAADLSQRRMGSIAGMQLPGL